MDEIKSFPEVISLYASSGYREEIRSRGEEILGFVEEQENLSRCFAAQMQHEPDHKPPRKVESRQSKVKVKTRSERSNPTGDSPKPVRELIQVAESSQPIALKCSFEVSMPMYPKSEEKIVKCIDWDAFVRAMVEVRFKACHNGGSAAAFECSRKGERGSSDNIIVHGPHLVPKVAPVMFVSMGESLRKLFQWHLIGPFDSVISWRRPNSSIDLGFRIGDRRKWVLWS